MTPFAIAGIQMHIAAHNNIDAIRHRVDLLMHLYPWVQMIVLSELAPFGPLLEHAQELPGPAEEPFQALARKHRVWMCTGSMFERCEGAIYNTSSVINPDGEVVGRHRKVFPFFPFESGVTPGEDFLLFDVPDVGRFAVLICFDMWFPETTRTVTAMGAEVILHPVLTHTIDRDVELSMAQANAAMFQCYVFDINGLGAGGNGQSCVVDPSGRYLHKSLTNEEFIPIEIDLDVVRRQRETGMRGLGQTLKSFRDRRVDLTVYDRNRWNHPYLDTLGKLVKPCQGSVAAAGTPGLRNKGEV